MTTTSAKGPLSFICLQHVWTFSADKETLFLSEFVGIPGMAIEKAFRFGVETDRSGYPTVNICCYVNSVQLARLGFTVKEVACMVKEKEGSSDPTLHYLKNVNENGNEAVLFMTLLKHKSFSKPCLTFRLYGSGLVKQYAPSCFDVNIGQQLWNAALKGQLTDVVFQVGNSTFLAHRFILCARSPVFRAMFDADMVESQTGRVHISDVLDPEIFEHFLRFLYTGQLVKPLSKQLEMVAEKYQVEILEALSRASLAIEGTNDDGLNTIATCKRMLVLNPFENIKVSSCPIADKNPSTVDLLHTELYTAYDVIAQYVNKPSITTTPPLPDFIRFKLEFEGDSPIVSKYAVTFYSSWRNASALRVTAVDLFQLTGDGKAHSKRIMKPFIPPDCCDKQPLQVFRASGLCINETANGLRFVVHFASTGETYQNHLRDSTFAQELWSTVINKERTDVEFQVADKIFSAHRALLAARCPALAALIIPAASSPPSSSATIISIPIMDPIVFEILLYFLYTGSIRECTAVQARDLSEAARIYQIETLRQVLEQQVDQDELSKVLIAMA